MFGKRTLGVLKKLQGKTLSDESRLRIAEDKAKLKKRAIAIAILFFISIIVSVILCVFVINQTISGKAYFMIPIFVMGFSLLTCWVWVPVVWRWGKDSQVDYMESYTPEIALYLHSDGKLETRQTYKDNRGTNVLMFLFNIYLRIMCLMIGLAYGSIFSIVEFVCCLKGIKCANKILADSTTSKSTTTK